MKIKTLWTDADTEVANLTADISQYQEKLAALTRRLYSKRMERNDYKVILSPLRRLPYDVLCEVFLSSLYDIPDSRSSSTIITDTPWTLTHVSSHWRSVALSFPQLWSTIRVTGTGYCFPLLKVQLERSGSYPLSISLIQGDFRCCWTAIEDIPVILQKLMSLSPRWRTLHIFFDEPAAFTILSYTPLQLHSLTSVSIRTTRRMTSPWDFTGIDEDSKPHPLMSTLFQDCPSLRTLGGQPHALSACSLPWTQINKYECNSLWYLQHYLKLLTLLPNLQECHICSDPTCSPLDFFQDNGQTGTSNQIVLRHLEYLTLSETSRLRVPWHSKTVKSLFNHLTLPSLTTLKLDRTLLALKANSLTQFFSRSQCPLATLDLKISNLSDGDCLGILEALPTLITLILTRSSIRTIDFLGQVILKPTLVPLLQLVEILYSAKERYDSVDFSMLKIARPSLRLRQVRRREVTI